jgi:uroporphyrinogen decarboxylase
MNSRERMLTALSNGRPDHLPCQVHGWMGEYLHLLGGIDGLQAFERFDMDFAIYTSPWYTYSDKSKADWQVRTTDLGKDENGNECTRFEYVTPKGSLFEHRAHAKMTNYVTDYPIKTMKDFEIWNEFYPVESAVDFAPIQRDKERLGDRGIIRSHPFYWNQGSPWQCFTCLFGTEKAIVLGMEDPQSLHHIL